MQKLIIDTNVIVSALISRGIPFEIVYNLALVGKVQLYISQAMLKEYITVLGREKFSKIANFKSNAYIVIEMINELSVMAEPKVNVELLRDNDDNKFLELALEVEADFIVTGNTRHFTIPKIGSARIVTPSEYWMKY